MNKWLWRVRHALANTTDWSWYPANRFVHGLVCKVPLSDYEKQYGMPSQTDGGRFGLSLTTGTGYCYNFIRESYARLGGLYTDAEKGFVLEYCTPRLIGTKRIPIAMTSFEFECWSDGPPWVIVRQLQGVKGCGSLLRGVRWERLLLNAVSDWARAHGHDTIACIRGQSSKWCTRQNERAFYLRYDVTARRL